MKTRSFIFRCAVFCLLLAFSQKTGAGLFLHNLLHTENTTPGKQDNKNGGVSFTCSCIDDFLMPFTGTEEAFILSPAATPRITVAFSPVTVPFRPAVFSSLRGPPAIL